MQDTFKRWRPIVSIAFIIAMATTLCFGTTRWHALMALVLQTAAYSAGIAYLIRRYDAQLSKRIAANAPITWDVHLSKAGMDLSKARMGTLTDEEYALMQRAALRDNRNAAAQLLNVVEVALNIVRSVLSTIPMMLMWGLILALLVLPEQFVTTIQEIQTADTTQIILVLRIVLQLCLMVAGLIIFISAFSGVHYGFRNYYTEAVGLMARIHCNLPATGDIRIIRSKT